MNMVFIVIPFGSSNRMIIIIQFRCLTIYSLLIYDRLYRKTKRNKYSSSKNCYERNKRVQPTLLTAIHLHLNCWVSPVTQIRWSLLAEKDKKQQLYSCCFQHFFLYFNTFDLVRVFRKNFKCISFAIHCLPFLDIIILHQNPTTNRVNITIIHM